jgi:uncharacterized protein YjbI with pentapeptide repeats
LASKPPIAPSPPDLCDELAALELPATLNGHEIERALLQRLDLSNTDARRLQLTEARLAQVDLTGAVLEHATLRDVIVTEGSWANTRAGGRRRHRNRRLNRGF